MNTTPVFILTFQSLTGYKMHQRVEHSRLVHSAQTFCSVFISEQNSDYCPIQHKLIDKVIYSFKHNAYF